MLFSPIPVSCCQGRSGGGGFGSKTSLRFRRRLRRPQPLAMQARSQRYRGSHAPAQRTAYQEVRKNTMDVRMGLVSKMLGVSQDGGTDSDRSQSRPGNHQVELGVASS